MQARLRYWNYATNLLTRMFALEYGYWFGIMLPGLDRLGLPIPLGGTSNHFRVARPAPARRLGPAQRHRGRRPRPARRRRGLPRRGDRLRHRRGGLRAAAPWIRQRTRWIKGYMQTALVHTRSPRRLVRQVGAIDALGFLR